MYQFQKSIAIKPLFVLVKAFSALNRPASLSIGAAVIHFKHLSIGSHLANAFKSILLIALQIIFHERMH